MKLIIDTVLVKETVLFTSISLYNNPNGTKEILAYTYCGEFYRFSCGSNENTISVYEKLSKEDIAYTNSYKGNHRFPQINHNQYN